MKELNKQQTEAVSGARRLPKPPKRPPITTLAIGEEGGPIVTTLAIGEEGSVITTMALGEEGGATGRGNTGGALGSF